MRRPFAINSQSSHLVGRSCSYHTLIQTIYLQLGGHCSFPMNIAAPLNPASAGVTPSWSKENSSGAQYRQQQFSSEVGESPAISNRVTWNTCVHSIYSSPGSCHPCWFCWGHTATCTYLSQKTLVLGFLQLFVVVVLLRWLQFAALVLICSPWTGVSAALEALHVVVFGDKCAMQALPQTQQCTTAGKQCKTVKERPVVSPWMGFPQTDKVTHLVTTSQHHHASGSGCWLTCKQECYSGRCNCNNLSKQQVKWRMDSSHWWSEFWMMWDLQKFYSVVLSLMLTPVGTFLKRSE